MIERRLVLHERAGRDIRSGDYAAAAHSIRRLVMTLPVNHAVRGDLLTVLAFVERQPVDGAEESHSTTSAD